MGYQEDIAAANQAATREQRLANRNAVRAQYGMGAEKRKRGGVAGTWDRNKKVIAPLVNIAAGAVGGPMLSALTGGLMKGLDREGKSGIGFDAKKGLVGAATGYATGATAGKIARSGFNAAKAAGGFSNLGAAAKNAATAMRGETGRILGIGGGAGGAPAGGGGAVGAGGAGGTGTTSAVGTAAGATGGSSPMGSLVAGRGIIGRPLAFLERNPILAAQLISGAMSGYGTGQQQELDRQERERQLREEQTRAQLLMPLFRQYLTGGQV